MVGAPELCPHTHAAQRVSQRRDETGALVPEERHLLKDQATEDLPGEARYQGTFVPC